MGILEGRALSKRFGGRLAVDDVDFDLEDGEILGLIGPNGAGKTTLFNLISGAITPDSGAIAFEGKSVGGLAPHRLCRLGIARTFQKAKNFPGLSVYDNVLTSAQFGKKGRSDAAAREMTERTIEFVGLGPFLGKSVTDLPLAGQKRLEVARALATAPRVLLLDEVMAGLNPSEVGGAMELIAMINESGVAVIMIEHVMKAIMGVCGRVMVLHHGQKLAEGAPEDISRNPAVIEVYLGGRRA
ncbi:MAG: ABC transporter ATP-binding protein [Oscillospiraceae bacterium]|nr:ABC transporter ATP-binding protein [Oscillospiraceae bacterium]